MKKNLAYLLAFAFCMCIPQLGFADESIKKEHGCRCDKCTCPDCQCVDCGGEYPCKCNENGSTMENKKEVPGKKYLACSCKPKPPQG